jgi:uncharacterized protein (TIGR00251 family)
VGRLQVRVQPRAHRDEIAGERHGVLLVRVTAPPVEGRANEAVRKLVAKRLGVAPGRVTVVRGATAREKLIDIEGIDGASLRRALGGDD